MVRTSAEIDTPCNNPHPANHPSVQLRKTSILMVDCRSALPHFMYRYLAQRYTLVEIQNTEHALTWTRTYTPALVIADITALTSDAYSLCRSITVSPLLACVSVLLLMQAGSRQSWIKGLSEGASDCLTTPLDVTEFIVRVDNLIARSQLIRMALPAHPLQNPSSFCRTMRGGAPDTGFLTRLELLIDTHLHNEQFGVPSLAKGLGMSRARLYCEMKDKLQTSPAKLLMERRLHYASALLAGGGRSVTAVAYGVGFKSAAHFSRCFRKEYGVSPKQYVRLRSLNRTNAPSPPAHCNIETRTHSIEIPRQASVECSS